MRTKGLPFRFFQMEYPIKGALLRFGRGLFWTCAAAGIAYTAGHLPELQGLIKPEYQIVFTLLVGPILQALDKYVRERQLS